MCIAFVTFGTNSILNFFIYQLRALKGQHEDCTYMYNIQYAHKTFNKHIYKRDRVGCPLYLLISSAVQF